MKIYKIAILGYPIKHTLSPKMHNYWLKELNINGKYEAIKTPVQNLKKNVRKKIEMFSERPKKNLHPGLSSKIKYFFHQSGVLVLRKPPPPSKIFA